MAARLLNDAEIAKSKRDFELKKAAYDVEVQTKVSTLLPPVDPDQFFGRMGISKYLHCIGGTSLSITYMTCLLHGLMPFAKKLGCSQKSTLFFISRQSKAFRGMRGFIEKKYNFH